MLASTAYWTAAVRARESARDDRLFNDPWAGALAAADGFAWLEQRPPDSTIAMVLRTRYFDDFLQRSLADSAVRQVVLMAAGLDTRAFRLGWPDGTRLFELDQAPLLEHKESVLRSAAAKPTCKRHAIAVDLTAAWEAALESTGFEPRRPSAWLLEGFLFYLSTEDLTRILDRTTSLATSGSYIGFDVINSITLTSPLTKNWVGMQAAYGAPWIGTMDDPQGFLTERGWKVTVVPLGAREANYDRWPFPVVPGRIPGMPHLWFVTGRKQ